MADNPQDRAQIIQMSAVTNSPGSNGQVWFESGHLWINVGGVACRIDHPATSAYTLSGVVPNRIFNAATATSLVTAQALGTLLTDLQTSGYIA